MDKAVFIKELKELFIKINKQNKKYSKVWLSDANFGGLYYTGKYILNIKSENHLDVLFPETLSIATFLHDTLDKEKYEYIFRVGFYNDNEAIPEEKDDIVLLDETNS